MATNYMEEGRRMAFTAQEAVKSGGLVMVGDTALVALKDVAAGAQGPGAAEGVYELEGKDPTQAIAQGEKVYRVTATGKLTNQSADAVYVGLAWEAAAQAAATVRVKLNA